MQKMTWTEWETLGRCRWVDVLDACCCGFHEAEEQKEAEERVGRGSISHKQLGKHKQREIKHFYVKYKHSQ